jgi:hypothetical protein
VFVFALNLLAGYLMAKQVGAPSRRRRRLEQASAVGALSAKGA